jgi:hypothetical protein
LLNDWAHNGPFGRASRQGSGPRIYEHFVEKGKPPGNHGTMMYHDILPFTRTNVFA